MTQNTENKHLVDTSLQELLKIAQSIIYELGAISMRQFNAVFPKINENDMERIILSKLLNKKKCLLVGEYLCPVHDTSMANSVTETCLWVALDIIDYDPNMLALISRTSSNDYLVIKNDTLYEIDYLHSNNLSSKIALINEKYNTIHKDNGGNIKYVLVLSSEELLDSLEDYALTFPHIFAIVNQKEGELRPDVLTAQ